MEQGNEDHLDDSMVWCDPLLPRTEQDNGGDSFSPLKKRSFIETSLRCLCLPCTVVMNCLGVCCCSKLAQLSKPPQWTWKLTMAITVMRTITNNIVRKISFIRCLTDQNIPTWLPSLPSGISIVTQKKDTNGCPVSGEWVFPSHLPVTPVDGGASNNTLDQVVLYLHGGAFALCTPGTHRGITMRLANKCDNAVVYVPNYCRPPEHPYPEPIDDCVATYKWLLRFVVGGNSKRIVIAGDSAGGALTILMFQKLQEENMDLPAGALLLSPWLDLEDTNCSPSWHENKNFDYLPCDLAHLLALSFVNNDETRLGRVSATNQELANLPPLFIMCGDKEVLRDQVITFCQKATDAGIDVERHIEPGMVHAFVAAFSEIIDKEVMDQWIERMALFIDKVTTPNGP